MAPAIELRGVTKRFLTPSGGVYVALHDLDLASEGEVDVFGKPVRGIADGIGFVFQNDAVFPWKTVLENVAAGPRYHGATNREARAAARDWIARVGLAGFEDRYPYQLSGGMRKRVALAQSLINGPRIL